jgi:hypothetical protein
LKLAIFLEDAKIAVSSFASAATVHSYGPNFMGLRMDNQQIK